MSYLVDYLLMFVGTIAAIGDGTSINVLLVFASPLMNSLSSGKTPQKDTVSLTSRFI